MVQPKYQFGQEVVVEIDVTANRGGKDFTFKEKITGFISVIEVYGTEAKDTYRYGITTDMPRCYHYGETPFTFILEDDIVIK